jgi:hypothetical protein
MMSVVQPPWGKLGWKFSAFPVSVMYKKPPLDDDVQGGEMKAPRRFWSRRPTDTPFFDERYMLPL